MTVVVDQNLSDALYIGGSFYHSSISATLSAASSFILRTDRSGAVYPITAIVDEVVDINTSYLPQLSNGSYYSVATASLCAGSCLTSGQTLYTIEVNGTTMTFTEQQ